MSRFHWKNFIIALGLVVIVLAATLFFFPEWTKSNGLLLTLIGVIVVTVVGFVADWRTAFERTPPPEPPAKVTPSIGVNVGAQGNTSVGGDVVGRDKIINEAPPPTVTAL